jgi:hypothetical protein
MDSAVDLQEVDHLGERDDIEEGQEDVVGKIEQTHGDAC